MMQAAKREQVPVALWSPNGLTRGQVMGWRIGPLAATPSIDRARSVGGEQVFMRSTWNATHVASGIAAGHAPCGERGKAATLAWVRALLGAAPAGFWENLAPKLSAEGPQADVERVYREQLSGILTRALALYDEAREL